MDRILLHTLQICPYYYYENKGINKINKLILEGLGALEIFLD